MDSKTEKRNEIPAIYKDVTTETKDNNALQNDPKL